MSIVEQRKTNAKLKATVHVKLSHKNELKEKELKTLSVFNVLVLEKGVINGELESVKVTDGIKLA